MVRNLPSNAGCVGLIPGQGTRSHMPQGNEARMPELPSSHSTSKIQCSQKINVKKKNLGLLILNRGYTPENFKNPNSQGPPVEILNWFEAWSRYWNFYKRARLRILRVEPKHQM